MTEDSLFSAAWAARATRNRPSPILNSIEVFSLGPGAHPREHSKDGSDFGEAKRRGSCKVDEAIGTEDHDRNEDRIVVPGHPQ